ncbi:GNAT family N-acetyltransferase [Streptomyces sp. NPDC056500]|uniref:GNAT family N-acetyltransferase n=1 Tax=Streptomyces sp. NPDC056500 TaxID=3345840 RepID=UPI0036B54E2A
MGNSTAAVHIEAWAEGDLNLLRAANAPELMSHLGGSESDEQVVARHLRYLQLSADTTGKGRMYRIVSTATGEPMGTIGFWEQQWHGQQVYETGWTVLPGFQRRGAATAATLAVVEAARAERRNRYLHAFPSVLNDASNAVCRKVGFTAMGECEVEYPPGHPLQVNDWRLDLQRPHLAGDGPSPAR